MSEPKRIQLRRTKGWRKPEGAIVVARPSKWGNPVTIDEMRMHYPESGDNELRRMVVSDYRGLVERRFEPEDDYTPPTLDEIRTELAGHDLACWCPLEDSDGRRAPCHADVLLELANPEVVFSWVR